MSKADDYNQNQIDIGRLSIEAITKFVTEYQRSNGLVADGMAGPKTLAVLGFGAPASSDKPPEGFTLYYPMPKLSDGRVPEVTSQYRTKDRPNHNGVDLFYHWREGDKPDKAGDGLATGNVDGHPKWVVPYGVYATAAAEGRIVEGGKTATGYRCWVDHGNGWRTGYFHLLDLRYKIGAPVAAGTPLGQIGDNPADHDARHLHFELSPVGVYRPIDPQPYLKLYAT